MVINSQLSRYGSRYDSLVQAAPCGGKMIALKMLLKGRADLNIPNGEYGFAVQAATFHGRTEVINVLLEYGANPITKEADSGMH